MSCCYALQLYVRAVVDRRQNCVRERAGRSLGASAEGLAVWCGRGWLCAGDGEEGAVVVLDQHGLMIADVYLLTHEPADRHQTMR